MIDALRWLIVLEIVGIAFFPLSSWLLRALPDRGYGVTRIVGLLAVTYVTWLIGSFVPIVENPALPAAVLLVGGAACWVVGWRRAVADLRSIARILAAEEAVFLVVFIGWCLVRAYVIHPGIAHTEQPMDMALLSASYHSASYPIYDPWMSGHTLNYYYLGYLMYALLAKLSGVATSVAYNLALSTIPAAVASAAFGVAYALSRRIYWALLAPFFVTLLGNWHAIVKLHSGQTPDNTFWWFFDSTRVIGSGSTITEFPFFSFLLGDLHPHVSALPVVLLAITLACSFVFSDTPFLTRSWETAALLLCAAVAGGSLYTINSWDFPTYLALLCAALFVHGYLQNGTRIWWQAPGIASLALIAGSVILFAPFYLHFHSVTHGLGLVTTPSNIFEFMEVLGFFVLLAAALVTVLTVLLQPAQEEEIEDVSEAASQGRGALEAGEVQAWVASNMFTLALIAAAVAVAIKFHSLVLMILLAIAVGALVVLYRVLNTEEPSRADAAAVLLVGAGCLAAALPEVVYLRDVFDGSGSYRMNTVFKFDYQAWVLLGLAGSYAVYRTWTILRSQFSQGLGMLFLGAAVIGAVLGAVYTVEAPQGQSPAQGGTAVSLDAIASLRQDTQGASDAAMITWLQAHAPARSIELEAVGRGGVHDEYDAAFARIATFTGLEAVMGWEGHEYQWRGQLADIQTRVNDVNTIYTTANIATARRLLRKYHVRYVIAGNTEARAYGDVPGALEKFTRFMKVAYRSPDGKGIIYTF